MIIRDSRFITRQQKQERHPDSGRLQPNKNHSTHREETTTVENRCPRKNFHDQTSHQIRRGQPHTKTHDNTDNDGHQRHTSQQHKRSHNKHTKNNYKNIQQTTQIISTIPPMNIDSGNEDTNEEIIEGRIQLNKEITKTYPTTVKTTSLNKSMRTNPHEILRDDGFHLNDKGAEQLAEEWIRTIEEPHTTNTNTQTTETMTINKDIAAHIIGKDGRNLKTMKEKHQITITTANDNHNNLTITITGNKDHTKEAIQDIKRTIGNTTQQHTSTRRETTEICK